MIADTVH